MAVSVDSTIPIWTRDKKWKIFRASEIDREKILGLKKKNDTPFLTNIYREDSKNLFSEGLRIYYGELYDFIEVTPDTPIVIYLDGLGRVKASNLKKGDVVPSLNPFHFGYDFSNSIFKFERIMKIEKVDLIEAVPLRLRARVGTHYFLCDKIYIGDSYLERTLKNKKPPRLQSPI